MTVPALTAEFRTAITNNTDGIFAAYQRLLPYELAQTDRDIARLRTAGRRGLYTPEVAAARTLWATVPTLPAASRVAPLEIVLKSINDLSPRVRDELAHQGDSGMDDDQQQPQQPTSAVRNRQVDSAIDLLTVRVVKCMQGPNATQQVTSDILLMFGNTMPQAIPRIKEIVDLLRELYNRPSPDGYVLDTTLPSSMAALGTNTGVRTTSYIRLATSALNGTVPVPDLACTLMHEGSHLIADSTIDFAYRGSLQHYFLPPELALYNAANYEQIAVNATGTPDQPPGEPEIAAARAVTAQPRLLAVSLLTAQITRAWVRCYQTASSFRAGRAVSEDAIVAALDLPTAAWAEDQRLRSRFTAYIDKITAASSTTEQLEDYYRQREDDT
jgi:hypothetical protein